MGLFKWLNESLQVLLALVAVKKCLIVRVDQVDVGFTCSFVELS